MKYLLILFIVFLMIILGSSLFFVTRSDYTDEEYIMSKLNPKLIDACVNDFEGKTVEFCENLTNCIVYATLRSMEEKDISELAREIRNGKYDGMKGGGPTQLIYYGFGYEEKEGAVLERFQCLENMGIDLSGMH
jgi:hypothetical protein